MYYLVAELHLRREPCAYYSHSAVGCRSETGSLRRLFRTTSRGYRLAEAYGDGGALANALGMQGVLGVLDSWGGQWCSASA